MKHKKQKRCLKKEFEPDGEKKRGIRERGENGEWGERGVGGGGRGGWLRNWRLRCQLVFYLQFTHESYPA